MGIVIGVIAMLVIPALLLSMLGRAIPPLGRLMKALAPLLALGCFGLAIADFFSAAASKGGAFALLSLLGLAFLIYGGRTNKPPGD